MHQQLWGYKVEEKLYVGVREQKRLNTNGLVFSINDKSFITNHQLAAPGHPSTRITTNWEDTLLLDSLVLPTTENNKAKSYLLTSGHIFAVSVTDCWNTWV
jgi:hypothetical protein